MALEYPRDMLTRLVAEKSLRLSSSDLLSFTALVDVVFFASLMIEEGEYARVAIVHDDRGSRGLEQVRDTLPGSDEDPLPAWDVTRIPRKPYDAQTLSRLSRGVAYGSQLVVVGGTCGTFWIDGLARIRRRTDGGDALRIAAPRPGVVVFERQVSQFLRFEAGQRVPQHIDVIAADGPVRRAMAGIIGEKHDNAPAATNIGGHTYYSLYESALRRLIQKMRATGSGALLALLPHRPDVNVLKSVRYRRSDPALLQRRIEAGRNSFSHRIATHGVDLDRKQVAARDASDYAAEVATEELEAALEDAAQLSAIDGAMLAGPNLAIYGAGYLIPAAQLSTGTVRRALDPRGTTWEAYPAQHGARHAAGFAFAYQNPGAVAFVVSEDGPVRCALRADDHVMVWQVEVLET